MYVQGWPCALCLARQVLAVLQLRLDRLNPLRSAAGEERLDRTDKEQKMTCPAPC